MEMCGMSGGGLERITGVVVEADAIMVSKKLFRQANGSADNRGI